MIRDEDQTVLGFRNQLVETLAKKYKGIDAASFNRDALQKAVVALRQAARDGARLVHDDEYLTARAANFLLGTPAASATFLASLRKHAAWSALADDAVLIETARTALEHWCLTVQADDNFAPAASNAWVSFKTPAKTDVQHLVHHPEFDRGGYQAWAAEDHHRRRREIGRAHV